MCDFPNEINGARRERGGQPMNERAEPQNFDDIDLSVLFDFEEAQGEGEPDLIVELIDLYLEEFPQQLSAIKDSILRADEVSLKRCAHTFKGSSANLGVTSVARICEDLEQTDFSEGSQKINVCFNRLEEAFARVRQIFTAERQKRTAAAN